MSKDPKKVSAGRLGAASTHARGLTNTGPARRAFEDKFLDEVDPDRKLSEEERQRRAEHARTAFYVRLSQASARARRTRKSA